MGVRAYLRLAIATTFVSSASNAAADDIDYTTLAGDTCESIAKKLIGDGKACAEIRTQNPAVTELKDDKAKLKAGVALKVPKPKPAAVMSATEGTVDVAGTSAKNGMAIVQGSPVTTSANAHSEVTLKDGWKVLIAPTSSFVVLGKPTPKGAKKLVTGDCTLASGTIHVSTPSALPKAVPIDTAAGKASIAPGTEVKLQVENGATRVSVHKGKVTLGATEIREGFGLEVGKGKWPGKAVALPDAPKWTAPPKNSYVAALDGTEETAKVSGMIGGVATKWHLQVAMDAQMTEYLVDLEIKSTAPTLMVEQKLPAGKFWFRVSAIDAAGLESTWSPVVAVTIEKPAPKVPDKPKPKIGK